jgi:hypothetical protein
MTEDRLSNLSIYSTECDAAKCVSFDGVLSDFAGNKRRMVIL